VDIINHSSVAVFNTNYVYRKYIDYISPSTTVKICPLGVNFDFFRPIPDRHPGVLPDSVIFIGASTDYPKGFNVLLNIIHSMPDQTFCLVMKDDFSINGIPPEDRHRVRIFNRVNQETVRLLINSCIAAVCTSYEETQHLSGIECGACNIPIVARMVGVYYDNREDPRWGRLADDSSFVNTLRYVVSKRDRFSPRECFIEKYSTEICRRNWLNIIQSL
jgi:glycosyltransferase involved in cell wall biosynthesis